ncbi:hypothetical protein RMATCC62417_01208 [Rhizopus microsporus]|nr:hypothetical protein RMATCC62417_01208 [Rhizopus microsporus]
MINSHCRYPSSVTRDPFGPPLFDEVRMTIHSASMNNTYMYRKDRVQHNKSTT